MCRSALEDIVEDDANDLADIDGAAAHLVRVLLVHACELLTGNDDRGAVWVQQAVVLDLLGHLQRAPEWHNHLQSLVLP